MLLDETLPHITNCIGIARGFIHDLDSLRNGHNSLEAALLRVPDGYHCVDISLYKVRIRILIIVLFSFGCSNSYLLSKTGRTNCVAIKWSNCGFRELRKCLYDDHTGSWSFICTYFKILYSQLLEASWTSGIPLSYIHTLYSTHWLVSICSK